MPKKSKNRGSSNSDVDRNEDFEPKHGDRDFANEDIDTGKFEGIDTEEMERGTYEEDETESGALHNPNVEKTSDMKRHERENRE